MARPERWNAATRWLAPLALLVLSACESGVGSIPGVFTTGDVRVLALEPDVRECVVHEGIWLLVQGRNLGREDAWASGANEAVFPPHPPGIEAEQVELTSVGLFVLVPTGAASGTLLIDAGTSGMAEIPITVEGSGPAATEGSLIGTLCSSNPPPGS